MKKTIEQIMSSYNGDRTETDLRMRQWMVANSQKYNIFKAQLMQGDMDALTQLFNFMRKCLSTESKAYYKHLGDFHSGKIDLERLFRSEPWLKGKIKELYDKKAWENAPRELTTIANDIISNRKNVASEAESTEIRNNVICFYLALQEQTISFSNSTLDNMRDMAQGKDGDILKMLYCFAVFDCGVSSMVKVLNECLLDPRVDSLGQMMGISLIPFMVKQTTTMGIETKGSWNDIAKDCGPEMWKEIALAVRTVTTIKKNKAIIKDIDELCDKEVQEKIREFLAKNKRPIDLAYLLKALTDAGKIDGGIKYMTFHRAIEQMTGKSVNHAYPQRFYNELQSLKQLDKHPNIKYVRAKRVIDEWSGVFANCA